MVDAYLYPARSAMDQSWIRSVVVGSAYWSWGAYPAGASSCWLFVLSGKQSREVVTEPCLAPLSWVQCQQEGWISQRRTVKPLNYIWAKTGPWFSCPRVSKPVKNRSARSLALPGSDSWKDFPCSRFEFFCFYCWSVGFHRDDTSIPFSPFNFISS